MVYNKDLFDEAGLDYPTMDWDDDSWNWDVWMEYAEKLTKFDASGRPVQYAMSSIGDTRYALRNWGLEWWNKEMLETGYPTEFAPDKDGMIETLQHWQDLMYELKYVPTPAESDTMRAATPNLFLTGKMAMQMTAGSALVWGADIIDFEWGVCPIPYPVGRPRWNYSYIDPWAIITPQDHPDAAWELLKFAASVEGQQLYPIEALAFCAPRRSLEDYFADYMLSYPSARHEFTREEIDVVLTANEICQLAWGHPAVEYERYQNEGLRPSWELLLANEIDGRECVARMEEAVMPIMEEITPEWAWEYTST
jgi:ABC-type glycerol-3-phosphate transport system substrate-binding protein